MQSQSLREKILTHAAHQNCVWGEEPPSVYESTSLEGDRVVSLSHYEHTDESLVSIDHEVATELSHVFLLLNKLNLAQAIQVAELAADHDWHVTEAQCNFLFRLGVDSPCDGSVERSAVG